jgi:hypothetical protein
LANVIGILKLIHAARKNVLELGMLSLGEFSQEIGHRERDGGTFGVAFNCFSARGGAGFTYTP